MSRPPPQILTWKVWGEDTTYTLAESPHEGAARIMTLTGHCIVLESPDGIEEVYSGRQWLQVLPRAVDYPPAWQRANHLIGHRAHAWLDTAPVSRRRGAGPVRRHRAFGLHDLFSWAVVLGWWLGFVLRDEDEWWMVICG